MNLADLMQRARSLCQGGQPAQAAGIFRQLLVMFHSQHQALGEIGLAAMELGLTETAIAAFDRAVSVAPDQLQYRNNLGFCLSAAGRHDQAIAVLEKAVAIKPAFPDAWYNLGLAFQYRGTLPAAVTAYRQAVQYQPNYPKALANLGICLRELGETDAAMSVFEQAVRLDPGDAVLLNNLGNFLWEQGRLDQAAEICRQAIAIAPGYGSPYNNLGNIFKSMGRLDDALAAYRSAADLMPHDPSPFSNYLYVMHFHPRFNSAAIRREHLQWDKRYPADPQQLSRPYANDRSGSRRLRVGYVSGDFSLHPVGRFLLPLLREHDRESVEVFAYSHVTAPDDLTVLLRSHCDAWRDTYPLSQRQLVEQIRADRIDILVDLAMHSANNRMTIFAARPAPVQVCHLAYCSTTGLSAMDYRLSDPYLDPPGTDGDYTETTYRLPRTWWCYENIGPMPAIAPPPSLVNGHVTFGCLNNFAKVSDDALQAWSQILQALPTAALVMYVDPGDARQRLLSSFARQGIDPHRLILVGKQPLQEYFSQYSLIDIALDPFPCAGGTTTCDALWMGVPVVSLAGRTAVGRAGSSILNNLGLSEWLCETSQQYVATAIKLANDLPQLSAWRSQLRDRLNNSPLGDARQYARDMENAYRIMWNRWLQCLR